MRGGPNRVTAGEPLTRIPAVTSRCASGAPVLELADRRGLQPRAHSGRPGPIPGWGTSRGLNQRRRDNCTKWLKNAWQGRKRAENEAPRKNDLLSVKTRKWHWPDCLIGQPRKVDPKSVILTFVRQMAKMHVCRASLGRHAQSRRLEASGPSPSTASPPGRSARR